MAEAPSTMWDMYSNDTPSSDNSWNFGETINEGLQTTNSWIDSLSETFNTVVDMKLKYETAKGSSAKDVKQKEYEKASQEMQVSNNQIANNQMLVYGGIGLVAMYFIFGDK